MSLQGSVCQGAPCTFGPVPVVQVSLSVHYTCRLGIVLQTVEPVMYGIHPVSCKMTL